MNPVSLERWRNYFSTSSGDIFEIIQNAIIVASSDCPKEFTLRRDTIAELLFSRKLAKCSSCSRRELALSCNEADEGSKSNADGHGCDSDIRSNKRSNVESTNFDPTTTHYSLGEAEAEALTDEIEEEGRIFSEVLRIKNILRNHEDESESFLSESLRRLHLMNLSVDILKTTEVGREVNRLRKHSSKKICHLSRELVEGWKEMVHDWVTTTTAITEQRTPDSVNPSFIEEEEEDHEEGLPSPPLDEGAFLTAAPATQLELTDFFNGMDDDGNPNVEPNNKENHRRNRIREPTARQRFTRLPNSAAAFPQEGGDAVQMKFEATKRKLRERYEEAENEKKQRRIQVMELGDIPKHRHANTKNRTRPSSIARR